MHNSLELINALRDGDVLQDLDDAATEVWTRVIETGKPGQMTFTLIFKPATKGNRNAIAIVDDIKTKLPPYDKEETLLYRDASGRFTRRDPRQPELPGTRVVARNDFDPETGEIKETVNG